jgi:acid phosphatase type 7
MNRTALLVFSLPLLLPAQERIAGGPYVVNATGRAATIGWIVQTGGVKIADRTIPVLRSEKISMTGLQPGKSYDYETPAGNGSFKTSPAAGASFEFVVFGDTRTRHDLHRKIVEAIAKDNPDFIAHTGDLVTDGYDTEQWPRFFAIEGDLLKKTVFFPALGNHERNNVRFYEFFDVKTPYYSFDWGSVHVTILNTDLGNVAISPEGKEAFWREQTRWMQDDLAKSQKADFRFVVMHHPPFTAVKNRQGDNREVQALVPLFEKYKVNAVFAGHDHNYQRHVYMGVQYVVTGGGGAPLYPVDGPIPGITQKIESTEHYVRVRVEPGKAVLEAIALDGHTIESFELKR